MSVFKTALTTEETHSTIEHLANVTQASAADGEWDKLTLEALFKGLTMTVHALESRISELEQRVMK